MVINILGYTGIRNRVTTQQPSFLVVVSLTPI